MASQAQALSDLLENVGGSDVWQVRLGFRAAKMALALTVLGGDSIISALLLPRQVRRLTDQHD